MKTGAPDLPFATVTALAVSVFTATCAGAFTGQSECYGDTLELNLVQGTELEPAFLQLHLPYTDVWIVSVGRGKDLIDLPCAEEPANAVSAVSPVTHGILPDETRDILERQGVLLTTLVLSTISPEGLESDRRSQNWWWENVFATADVTPDGHLRRPSVDGDAIGGSWLLTADHPDVAGDRIDLGCALDCTVSYRIRENLLLRYHLAVADRTKQPEWVALDTALRNVVQEWIVGS